MFHLLSVEALCGYVARQMGCKVGSTVWYRAHRGGKEKKKKVSLGLRAVFQEIKPISLVKLFDRKPFCGLYSIPLFPHALSLCLRTTL